MIGRALPAVRDAWAPGVRAAVPVATFVIFVPGGGVNEKVEAGMAPYPTSVARSSRTGWELPRAYTAIRSGTPRVASQASSTAPSSPARGRGERRTV